MGSGLGGRLGFAPFHNLLYKRMENLQLRLGDTGAVGILGGHQVDQVDAATIINGLARPAGDSFHIYIYNYKAPRICPLNIYDLN